MSLISDRLKEERARLRLSQPAFGEIANATKWSVIAWEKGETSPDATQLGLLAAAGLDVLYVVTGARGGLEVRPAPFDPSQEIAKQWRTLGEVDRQVVAQMIQTLAAARKP